MATVKTGPDSVRVFLTGNTALSEWSHALSLGGSKLPIEVGQGFYVADPIPGIYIEMVVTTVEGVGYLEAVAGTLSWKAPGDSAYGTGVALASGASAILRSFTASLGYIRVMNMYAVTGYTGLATLTVMNETNNAIGMSNSLIAGETAYRALMLQNMTDTLITVSATTGPYTPHPFYIGFETPDVNQQIQTIADEHTAPIGITWRELFPISTSAPLQGGALAGLWFKRVIEPCADPIPSLLRALALSWTYSGAQTRRLSGRLRVLNAAPTHELYTGEDALPNFSAAPSDSGSLPLSVVVTPPGAGTKTVYLCTREVSTGALRSLNQYAYPRVIGADGEEVIEPLHAPSGTSLEVLENCMLRLRSNYVTGFDATEADYFKTFLTTDATTPTADEIVSNGDMELDSDWVAYGAATVSRSSTQKHAGTYSRKCITTASGQGIQRNGASFGTLSIGVTYLVTGWIWGNGAATLQASLDVAGFGEGGGIGPATVYPASWTQFSFNVTPTGTGATNFLVLQTAGAAATFYIDDVSVTAVATYTTAMRFDGFSTSRKLNLLLGPYVHAQSVKALVRSYRSSDLVSSDNTDIVTTEITTSRLRGADQPQSLEDDLVADAGQSLPLPSFTLVEHVGHNIYWQAVRGQVRFYFDTVCAFVITDTEFRTMWTMSGGGPFGAATKNGVDVADVNTAYLSVDNVRVAKLDLAALEITMFYTMPGPVANVFQSGPIYVTDTAMYFQAWIGGLWRTVATLAADGTFATDLITRGCSTTDELFG